MRTPLPRTALFGALLLLAVAASGCGAPAAETASVATVRTASRIVEVGPLRIDGIAHSMEGEFQRAPLDTAGIGWITGFRTEVVDAASGTPLGDEFFCHSQVQLATGARLLVAATGIRELRLPEGFGIPLEQILGDLEEPWRPVSLLGMVLNNHRAELRRDVKLRFVVDYVPDDDRAAAAAVSRLYRASVTILPDREGVEILEGAPLAPVSTPRWAHGKTGHWIVPPGRQVIRQRYRGLIPGPTRVHYAAVHLHNHSRSVTLNDLTTGETLWSTEVVYEDERDQIREIPVYSSAEGFPMSPDHEYELVAEYRNDGDEPVDAMATMYLYHHPEGDRRMTYPPAPGATPPGATTSASASGGHSHH